MIAQEESLAQTLAAPLPPLSKPFEEHQWALHSSSPLLSTAPLHSSRNARVTRLLEEFDRRFLQTDARTGRQYYPVWAEPYVHEMMTTLRQGYLPRSQQMQQQEEKAQFVSEPPSPSRSTSTTQNSPSLVHRRYDSILDQYYPGKSPTLSAMSAPAQQQSSFGLLPKNSAQLMASPSQSSRSSVVSTRSSFIKTMPLNGTAKKPFGAAQVDERTARRSLSLRPTKPVNCPFVASVANKANPSLMMSPKSARLHHEECENPGQKIRVTKLHEAMVDQINLLSTSLQEAWSKLQEHELNAEVKEQRVQEVVNAVKETALTKDMLESIPLHDKRVDVHDAELQHSRQWRQWNRDKLGDLIEQTRQLSLSQQEATARVESLEAEQAHLQKSLSEARDVIESEQAKHAEAVAHLSQWNSQDHESYGMLMAERERFDVVKSEMAQKICKLTAQVEQLEFERLRLQGKLTNEHDLHNSDVLKLQGEITRLQNEMSDMHNHHVQLKTQHDDISLKAEKAQAEAERIRAEYAEALHVAKGHAVQSQVSDKERKKDAEVISNLEGKLREANLTVDRLQNNFARTKNDQDASASVTFRHKGELALIAQRLLVAQNKKKTAGLTSQVNLLQKELALVKAGLETNSKQGLPLGNEQRIYDLEQAVAAAQETAGGHREVLNQTQAQLEAISASHSQAQKELSATRNDLTSVDALNTQLLEQSHALQAKFSEFSHFFAFSQSSMLGDYMNAKQALNVVSTLSAHGDKVILFSDVVTRIDSHNRKLHRVIVVSETALYIFGSHSSLFQSSALVNLAHLELKRRIVPKQIKALQLSRLNANLMMLKHLDGYDHCLLVEKRNELMYFLLHLDASLKVEFSEELFVRMRDLLHQRLVRVKHTQDLELNKQTLVTAAPTHR